jgi:HD-GYP domain-containing protein (c-di-GMP phosphodiesterase class II)
MPDKLNVLICALTKETVEQIPTNPTIWNFESIGSAAVFEDGLDKYCSETYDLVICGDLFGASFMNEFGQVMRQQGSQLPLFSINYSKEHFQPVTFKKNGFSDSYFWPIDKDIIIEKINDVSVNVTPDKKNYKPIFVADLDSDSKVPFETYVHLPMNNKYIRFSAKDEPLGEKKISRLKEKDFSKLLIDKKNMDDFYLHVAEQLRTGGTNMNKVSETEKNEKIKSTVRNLFSEIFDQSKISSFDDGKELIGTCQKVISQFVTQGKTNNWYAQMVMSLGSAISSYDHASTISTLATLIAIGVGHKTPEDIAMAAFFHDIGRTDASDEYLNRQYTEWPNEVFEVYNKHPQMSINLLKDKKMIIAPIVEKAILQHHERFDGKGFPKQLAGDRISIEAQILSFADQLNYLTVPKDGVPRLSPMDAFNLISANGSIGSG